MVAAAIAAYAKEEGVRPSMIGASRSVLKAGRASPTMR